MMTEGTFTVSHTLDVQDILDQPLAEPLFAHDLLEDEIVRDGQILPGLQRIRSIRLVHWHAPLLNRFSHLLL